MKKVTPEFVQEIFYSGQFGFVGDLEITNEICFLINNNYLLFNQITIASKDQYLETASNQRVISMRDDASGGGNYHVALKLLAAAYIKTEYGVDSLFEQPFAGFIPDVLSADRRLVCECGHTNNPEKIFTYFRHEEVRYVIQIPYPSEDDTYVTGYEFQSQPQLISFLDFKSQDKNQAIKDILNNRKR